MCAARCRRSCLALGAPYGDACLAMCVAALVEAFSHAIVCDRCISVREAMVGYALVPVLRALFPGFIVSTVWVWACLLRWRAALMACNLP